MVDVSFFIGLFVGAVIVPISIIVILYLCLRNRLSRMMKESFSPPPLPSDVRVSLNWIVEALDGEQIQLDEECADQVVFLNFWGTHCGPCVAELPSIEELYNRFKGRVRFACISNDKSSTILAFRNKEPYTVPMYHLSGTLPDDLAADGIPATFIISSDRRVVFRHVGGADWAHESVVEFLDSILSKKT